MPWLKDKEYGQGIRVAIHAVADKLSISLPGKAPSHPSILTRLESNKILFGLLCLLGGPVILMILFSFLAWLRGYNTFVSDLDKTRLPLSFFAFLASVVGTLFAYSIFGPIIGVFLWVGITKSQWIFIVLPSILYLLVFLFPLALCAFAVISPNRTLGVLKRLSAKVDSFAAGLNASSRRSFGGSSRPGSSGGSFSSGSRSSSSSSSRSSFSGGGRSGGGGASSSW